MKLKTNLIILAALGVLALWPALPVRAFQASTLTLSNPAGDIGNLITTLQAGGPAQVAFGTREQGVLILVIPAPGQ